MVYGVYGGPGGPPRHGDSVMDGWQRGRPARPEREMAIRIVQLGSPRARGEKLRLGTVRRPPRGVPRTQFASRNFYDVWLPELAPSENLVKLVLWARDARGWRT